MFKVRNLKEGDCPIEHLTIHSKIQELVKLEILEEVNTYHPGLERGTAYTYKGNKIMLVPGFVGKVTWNNEYHVSYFDSPHDVVVDPVSNKMLAFAKS